MFSSLVCFFALILILCGLFFIFYLVISKLITQDSDGFFVAVIGCDDGEILHSRIYNAFIQANMMNFGKKRPVYVFDCGLSEKAKRDIVEAAVPGCRIIFLKSEDNSVSQDGFSIEKPTVL